MYLKQIYYYPYVMKFPKLKRNKIIDYQLKSLKEIIRHAYKTVPYYHRIFKKLNLRPEDIKNFKDLKKIPIIDKKEVIKNYEDFISKEYLELYDLNYFFKRITSGSTGIPFMVPYDQRGYDYAELVHLRAWLYAGYKLHEKIASYWYEPFKKRFYNYLGFIKKVYIPCNLSEIEQLRIIKRVKPKWLNYFPSSIYNMSKIAEIKDLRSLKIKGIITHAEILTKTMKNRIENTFNTDVYDEYGTTEFVRMAWQCKEKHYYHIDADSLFIEVIDKNGENVGYNKGGFIVVTGLLNYMFPLIRYNMYDIGELSDEKCNCGLNLPLIKGVYGRQENFIKLPSGRIISPQLFIDALDKIKELNGFQLFKKTKNELLINILLSQQNKKIENRIKNKIINCLQKITNGELNIIVETVDKLKKTERGKIILINS
ncbi:MAG: phenylacetate--CoA ligase family protein [Candidatus Woesearchaeota archaeon]